MQQLRPTSVTFASPPEPGVARRAASSVRPATADDLEPLVAMLRAFHADSSLHDVSLNEPKLRAFLRHAMTAPDHACLVYQAGSGTIDGVIIGFVTQHFFSLEEGAWDLVVYVRPERRGGIAAARLWSAFRDWAQRAGARTMSCGTTAGEAPERTRRFYTGLGMTEVGSIYLLALDHAR